MKMPANAINGRTIAIPWIATLTGDQSIEGTAEASRRMSIPLPLIGGVFPGQINDPAVAAGPMPPPTGPRREESTTMPPHRALPTGLTIRPDPIIHPIEEVGTAAALLVVIPEGASIAPHRGALPAAQ